jgi:DNA-binding transcriptional ArsR family regulator
MKNIPDDAYGMFFRALSNRSRLRIIQLLKKEPYNVSQLCMELKYKQSRVSRNLKFLTDCGFVQAKRDGKQKIYSLNGETIKPLVTLIDTHIEKYCRHLEKCGIAKKR